MRFISAIILLSVATVSGAANSLSPRNKALLDSLDIKFDSLEFYRTRKPSRAKPSLTTQAMSVHANLTAHISQNEGDLQVFGPWVTLFLQ